MAVYGLPADVEENKGRNVNLYVPGKTKLTAQDVFLGGPGTGVDDTMLNGATRVFGNDRKGTAMALNEYSNDLASQIKSAIATNAAPRADANIGMPTMARQKMEIDQAQNAIDNPMKAAALTGRFNNEDTLAQRTFNHNVGQDAFSNEYNVGNLMGEYQGKPTLSRVTLDTNSAMDRAQLAASIAKASSSATKASTPKPTEGDRIASATGQAQTYLSKWAAGEAMDDEGNLLPKPSKDEILKWIDAKSGELTSQRVNTSTLKEWADDVQWPERESEAEPAPYKKTLDDWLPWKW